MRHGGESGPSMQTARPAQSGKGEALSPALPASGDVNRPDHIRTIGCTVSPADRSARRQSDSSDASVLLFAKDCRNKPDGLSTAHAPSRSRFWLSPCRWSSYHLLRNDVSLAEMACGRSLPTAAAVFRDFGFSGCRHLAGIVFAATAVDIILLIRCLLLGLQIGAVFLHVSPPQGAGAAAGLSPLTKSVDLKSCLSRRPIIVTLLP